MADKDKAQEATPLSKAEAMLAQLGLTPEDIGNMFAPVIDKVISARLDQMKLGETIDKFNQAVNLFEHLQKAGVPVQAGVPAQGLPPAVDNGQGQGTTGDLVTQFLLRKMMGGDNSGGSDFGKLAEMMKSLNGIAELVYAPARRARLETLQEINEQVKFVRGLGVSTEKLPLAIERMTEADIKANQEPTTSESKE